MVRTFCAAAVLILAYFLGGCGVESPSTTYRTEARANAMAVTPTPLDRPRLYPRFHDLPDPALKGQAGVLKLAFADSDTLIDVPDSVNVALRNHWIALENYHRAKDEDSNVAQATFDHSMAAVNLINVLESPEIKTPAGVTHLDRSERDDVINIQVMLFSEYRNETRQNSE